jgi:hypothetical protein
MVFQGTFTSKKFQHHKLLLPVCNKSLLLRPAASGRVHVTNFQRTQLCTEHCGVLAEIHASNLNLVTSYPDSNLL